MRLPHLLSTFRRAARPLFTVKSVAWIAVGFAAMLLGVLMAGSTWAASAPFIAKPARISATTQNACDPIAADTVWAAGVYTAVNCNIHIPAGVTLTIQAGAVVKMGGASPGSGSGAGSVALIVEGALVAQGTASQPVVFTSMKDDAHGGDTDHNGATAGGAGDWYGIVFRNGSVGRLDHFWMGYAGSGVFNASLGTYNRAQIDVQGADVQLRNGTITDGHRKGVYLEGAGITPVIETMTIAANKSDSPSSSSTLGYPIYQSTINMQPSYNHLTYLGNDVDAVVLNTWDPITQNVTLSGTIFSMTYGRLSVSSGVTATIAPGVQFSFPPATYGSYGSHSTSLVVVNSGGTFLADGTPAQPITFTSILTTPVPGSWGGIVVLDGAHIRLAYCDVGYAGDLNGYYGEGLEIHTDDARVSNCRIHHNKGSGLYIEPPYGGAIHPILTNVDVTDNGEYGVYLVTNHSSLSLTWEGGSISRNGWSGVSGYTRFSSVHPTLRNLTISSNGSLGDFDDRRQGISLQYHGMSPNLENLTLTGNAGAAVSWYCDGSISARNLTATGNGADVLELPGCSVGTGRQWDLGDVGIPLSVTNHIEVASGGFLSILPGTTLVFDQNDLGSNTSLTVRNNAALYALGSPDKPVVFTGPTQTPGAWGGILVYYYDNTALFLRNCEIAYGGEGGYAYANLRINGWDTANAPDTAVIQNCDIHHSSRQGVYFDGVVTPVVLRNNSIHDNAQEGVVAWGGSTTRDARYNWWGDASGPYHATTNPNGQGEEVGDNVLFDPWLTTPPTTTTPSPLNQVLLDIGYPTTSNAGAVVGTAIHYSNQLSETLHDAVLVLDLPASVEYLDSTGGGVFWPEKREVFWRLGDIAPGSYGTLAVQGRFFWGVPLNTSHPWIVRISAANYGDLDRTPYLNYAVDTISGSTPLSDAQFAQERATFPDLQTLYDQALARDFMYGGATRYDLAGGDPVLEAIMVKPGAGALIFLRRQGNQIKASQVDGTVYALWDTSGGLTYTLQTGAMDYWGAWKPATGDILAASTGGASYLNCLNNCVLEHVPGWILGKLPGMGAINTGKDCLACANPNTPDTERAAACAKCGGSFQKKIPLVGEGVDILKCGSVCAGDPDKYKCTKDIIGPDQSAWNLYNLLGVPSCRIIRCKNGRYAGLPEYLTCAFGQICVSGNGCRDCEDAGGLVGSASTTKEERCTARSGTGQACGQTLMYTAPHDPNEKYGPAGDLLPGQRVTYTIAFENVGSAPAYGVYITDTLDTVFDLNTLAIEGGGVRLGSTGTLYWLVGELAPHGEAGSTGVVTVSVNLRSDLPGGTVVRNQAFIYFPSVPEETPTDPVVNVVQPLVAHPQQVTTNYGQSTVIQLQGADPSNTPLSFHIVDAPLYGALSGTPPSVTYTPAANYSGEDRFSFVVDNGVTQSRPAQVLVRVLPSGDTLPPEVWWMDPVSGADNVAITQRPVFTDTEGSVFGPTLTLGFSEALDASTVTTQTVSVAAAVGGPISYTVRYNEVTGQALILPRTPWQTGTTYTVTVSTGVTDLAGNPLATAYQAQFTTAAPPASAIYLPMVVR